MFNILLFLFVFIFALQSLSGETEKKEPREIVLTGTDLTVEDVVAMARHEVKKIRNDYGFVEAVNLLQFRLLD